MAKYKEYGYDIQNGKAIIPEWKTEIGGCAVFGCSSLTEVRIPYYCYVDGFAFDNSPNVEIIRY